MRRLRFRGSGHRRRAVGACTALLFVLVGLASTGGVAFAAPTPRPAPFVLQRSILVETNQVLLVQGSKVVRTVPLAPARSFTLGAISKVIDDPTWLAQTSKSVWTAKAAIIQEAGTNLVVAAPAVTTLRLLTGHGVFVGGDHATANFRGVTVESWDAATNAPQRRAIADRPFVLYQNDSVLRVTDSLLRDLGSTVTGGSGVTWRNDATGGGASQSTFEGNYVGAEVNASGLMGLTQDTFSSNATEGLRLSNGTFRPTVRDDTARSNGTEGFSLDNLEGETTLVDDHSIANGASGFLISKCADAVVARELTSTGDTLAGIRVHRSDGVSVTGGSLDRDKIGIEIEDGSARTVVSGATLLDDHVGAVAKGAQPTTLTKLTVRGADEGLVLDTDKLRLTESTLAGNKVGVALEDSASLASVSIAGSARGVIVVPGKALDALKLHVSAAKTGVELGDGATATIVASTLHAPVPHEGGKVHIRRSQEEQPPVSWPVIIGGVALLLACLLMEVLRYVRERHDPPVPVSADFWNVT